jgi:hypothetical protein
MRSVVNEVNDKTDGKFGWKFDVASQRHAMHVPDDCNPSCEPDFKIGSIANPETQ